MSTVKIIFRNDKLNKNSEAPIHLRIIKDRKISYISTSIMLPLKFWDEKNHRIKTAYPNSARLNSYITNKFNELQDQVLEHETLSKALTSRSLRDKIYGKKPTDFFSFADEVNQNYLAEGKIGTFDKNKSILCKIRDFANGVSLSFQDIDLTFLAKYEKHLRNNVGNKTNTIHKDMKFIRKLFNDAYRQELIDHQSIPFLKYKLKTEKTNRTYLSEEELFKIEELKINESTRMSLHRDMFIFAAYSGGLRVSDILQLRWVNFDGLHISFTTRKTGQQLSIKLPSKALTIVRKYEAQRANNEGFIFSMLPDNLDMNNFREVDSAISSSTAYINKNLKFIAGKLKLNKHISFHTSRHSFACLALRKGISIDKVSKLMGHSAVRETQLYAKIMNEELDKAMDAFN